MCSEIMFQSSGQNNATQSSFVTEVNQTKYKVQEFLTTVATNNIVLCNVTPFNFVDGNQQCRLSLIIGEHVPWNVAAYV
jgi:hypothetical protein